MSVKAVSWVFDYSPYTLGARLVHLAVADVANEDNEWLVWVSHSKIATKAKVSRATVVASLGRMVEDGFMELLETKRGASSTYRFLTPNLSDIDTPTCRESDTTCQGDLHPPVKLTDSHLLLTQEELKNSSAKKPQDPLDLRARAIVDAAWEARSPKPTAKYMNLVDMAKRFLNAETPDAALTQAFINTAAFTDNAVMFQLNHSQRVDSSSNVAVDIYNEIEELVREGK